MILKSPILFCSFKKLVFTSFFLFCLLASCTKETAFSNTFTSNFKEGETEQYLKLDYWTKNPKDWQVTNDRIECLVSEKNSNIHLLTRRLENNNGDIEIKVHLGILNDEVSNKNWVGFHIGDKLNEKDNYNIRKGIDIGICTNGTLFIGTLNSNQKNSNLINALKTGVYLQLLIINNKKGNYTLDFSALEEKSGKVLTRISKKNVSEKQLVGSFSLVSNFENENNNSTANKTRSVWFKEWKIEGSKVTRLKV